MSEKVDYGLPLQYGRGWKIDDLGSAGGLGCPCLQFLILRDQIFVVVVVIHEGRGELPECGHNRVSVLCPWKIRQLWTIVAIDHSTVSQIAIDIVCLDWPSFCGIEISHELFHCDVVKGKILVKKPSWVE